MIKQKNTKAVELEMKNKMNVLRAAVIAGSVLAAGSVMAAGYQGELSETASQGAVELTATIPEIVRVTLSSTEVAFGTADFTNGTTATVSFCVESTDTADTVDLKIFGGETLTSLPTIVTTGAFTLYNDANNTETMDYTTKVDGGSDVASGVATPLTPDQLTSGGCTADTPIVYTLSATELQNASAGAYTGYSYLVVSP
jgi:hypothetical protein